MEQFMQVFHEILIFLPYFDSPDSIIYEYIFLVLPIKQDKKRNQQTNDCFPVVYRYKSIITLYFLTDNLFFCNIMRIPGSKGQKADASLLTRGFLTS